MSLLGAAAVGLVWMAALAAAADEPLKVPETPLWDEAVRAGWVRLNIDSGRIVVVGRRIGNIGRQPKQDDRSERLTVQTLGGNPKISYEMTSGGGNILIDVSRNEGFHARWEPPAGSGPAVATDLRQVPDEPLRLTTGPADEPHLYESPTFWHLLITRPEVCREHLAVLLAVLSKDRDMLKTADRVRGALVDSSSLLYVPDPGRWGELVKRLGDKQFSRRESADRELRAVGRLVVPYLQRLDLTRLDAEQQFRVRRIIRELTRGNVDETPQEIAAWLAGDPAIWLAMLSDTDEPTRRLAAERLGALLGRPVAFDPSADEATRQQQIEAIRSGLEGG